MSASALKITGGYSRSQHQHDKSVFHQLLEQHQGLQRKNTRLDNGIATHTWSQDAALTALLQEHVQAMHRRLKNGHALRLWDELYVEVFRHADAIDMQVENTRNGVRVRATSTDPYVIGLLHAHGQAVNAFVDKGFEAAQQQSPMPKTHTD